MSEVMVSILCMTYNHEDMLEQSLNGMLMQKTTFSFEIIVHDDASTDRTPEIVREYAAKYPDIIKPVLQTENQFSKGLAVDTEFMMPLVRGKYIAYCDGDDYWTDENKLQRQITFLEEHPAYTACAHNSIKIDCTTGAQDVMFPREEDCDITFDDTLYAWPRTYQPSSLVLRREYRDEVPEFCRIVKGFYDYPTGIWLAINGKIRFMNTCMSVYRYCSCPTAFMAQKEKQDPCILISNTLEMLQGVRPHVTGEKAAQLEEAILGKEFQLLLYQYRIRELRRAPYARLYKTLPFKDKCKLFLKEWFPDIVKRWKGIA